MKWLSDLPIKRKLIWINMASVSLALLLMTAILAGLERYTEYRTLVEQTDTLARVIGNRSAAAILFDDAAAARSNLDALKEVEFVIASCLFDRQGGVIAFSGGTGEVPEFCRARPQREGHWFADGVLNLVETISHSEENVGYIFIQTSLDVLTEHLFGMLLVVTLILVLVLLIMFLLAGYWHRVISLPLEQLAALARRVSSSHDYSGRAVKLGDDEVGALVDAFNDMLGTIAEQNQALRGSQARLERAVETRTRELTLANRELEAFSYSVSHDLRAPVRAILSFSQLVLEDAGEKLGDESRGDLERVVAGARRMEKLIDELLNMARVSRHKLAWSRVNLSALAADIMQELRDQQPERQVDVRIAPDLQAYADTHLTRVVLDNLLGNAWKYTGRVEQPRIEFGVENINNEQTFFIKDNGIGFDMDHASQLFTPFTRLHRNDEYEGTGIGLATVYRVIQRHGGRIWVSAREGRGATFYFTLGKPGDADE